MRDREREREKREGEEERRKRERDKRERERAIERREGERNTEIKSGAARASVPPHPPRARETSRVRVGARARSPTDIWDIKGKAQTHGSTKEGEREREGEREGERDRERHSFSLSADWVEGPLRPSCLGPTSSLSCT